MEEKKEKSFVDYMIGEGAHEISIFTRIKWKIKKIADAYRSIKWFLQRLFRSYHASDCDIWNLHEYLTPIILGKLIAFRNSPLHGYPSCFSEYCENEWKSKEEYDDAVDKGDILGGEQAAWLKVIDEMIFAFEFLNYYEASDKKRDKMLKKYGLEYPHKKIPENRMVHYVYKYGKGEDEHIMSSHLPPKDKENEKYTYLGEDVSYYNFDLEREYYERVEKGMKLFAKYYLSLWD